MQRAASEDADFTFAGLNRNDVPTAIDLSLDMTRIGALGALNPQVAVHKAGAGLGVNRTGSIAKR